MGSDGSRLPVVGRVVAFIQSSFHRKLATALLIVFLVTGGAAAGVTLQTGDLLRENVEQSMTAAADAEAGELEEWDSQNRLMASFLSEHPVYATDDPEAVAEYLRTQRETRQEVDIVGAYVIDRRNGTVVASADPELEGTDVAALPWEERFAFRDFDDVTTTRPYVVENDTTAIGYIAPIRQRPERLLVVEIDTASVFDRFEHPVDGGFTRVVNSNGTVVFADDPDATLQQYREGSARAPIVGSGLRGGSGFTQTPVYERQADGDAEYVAAYAAVPGANWVVVEHAPRENAYALLRQSRQATTWIALLTLTALLAVVAVLGADVTRALAGLDRRASELEAGNYDVSFDTDRRDEFGGLNRVLASMRDTLRVRISEIEETKAELERSNEALAERSSMVTVLNRVLRHNVRNDVNIIAGRAELAAERVDDRHVEADLDAIIGAARDLEGISERTRQITELFSGHDAETVRQQPEEAIPSALDEVGIPPTGDVTVDTEGAAAFEAPSTLPLALAGVVEQIIAENSGDVDVRIDVLTDDKEVVLVIDDDADGVPEIDVKAVKAGRETPLNHAQGLALWCLKWAVAKANGVLDTSPERGTLELRLPRATESD